MDNRQPNLIVQLFHGILAKLKKDCQFIYSDEFFDYRHFKIL